MQPAMPNIKLSGYPVIARADSPSGDRESPSRGTELINRHDQTIYRPY
jgi:hypothetical protein